ncbi:MAG: hypothetical protein Q8L05_08940 [Actinomycetota bacterium]|nr:hypothetical protein [Actinomycetota bacterium]
MKLMLVAVIAGMLFLAGCQSSSDSSPLTTCDQASLQTTIETFLHESDAHLDSFDQLKCSGEWAAVQATLTENASQPVQQDFIFARSGENWILKAPEIVCGSPSADNSRPADAEIPEDLWAQACLIP